ncbi:MAG: hypothetical protein JZU60_02125 [Ilumatobacteraceae bacterium]|jgi:hypothetical protein|nr:hypothetical protein [Ilumatobacteraceae bacterium]
MTKPKIETPKGSIVITKSGKAALEWSTDFQQKWQGNYSAAQKFVDSEILRLSEPFTPLLTSMLIKSGTLGTDIGSGTVQWIAPYARAQYYGHRSPGSQTGPLRGPQWFARMKEIHGEKIIAGARRIAGKGTK